MTDPEALRAFKAEFFKALAHPVRIQLLDAMRDGERGVGDLVAQLGIEAPNVSQQLAVLRARRLVLARKDGNHVYYRVADPAIFALLDVAKDVFAHQLTGVQAMLQTLAGP